MKSFELLGSGIFIDARADTRIRTAFFEQVEEVYKIEIPKYGIVEGSFIITLLSYIGTNAGGVIYKVGLTSTGKCTFTTF